MISVIIPTLDAADGLPETLAALVPGVVAGLIREVVIVDGGSGDQTIAIAEATGARVVTSTPGRGQQLKTGAEAASASWLLFLHADTCLAAGWEGEVAAFMERVETGKRTPGAAVFRFALDDLGTLPRLTEWGVALRCAVFRLPYGDQALLIPRQLYNDIGGFKPMPLLEDVDINRRLGRRRIAMLRTAAVTSAERYRRDGYVRRIARNWLCLTLYYCRVPVRHITRLYL